MPDLGSTGASTNRGGRRPSARPVLALLGSAVLIYLAATATPPALGPGVGIAVIGAVAGVVLYALNRPVLSVFVVLATAFLRMELKGSPLPVEPMLLAFAIALAAAVIAVTRRVSRAPSFGPLEGAMAMFILWNIGSAIAPHEYPASINQTIGESSSVYFFILAGTLMPFAFYVVGRFIFNASTAIRQALWFVVGFATYSAWVSIAQFYAPAFVWPRYILQIDPTNSWANRAVGVFAQPVANGLILIIGFGIAMHLLYDSGTQRWQRGFLAVFAVASAVGIYLTYTRVVWACFGMLVVLGSIFLRRGRAVYSSIIVLIVAGVVANAATFFSSDRSAGGIGSSYEVEDRLNMWATAFWAIGEKPWFGWGVGRFATVNTYHHQQWGDVPWARGYGIVSHMTELGIFAEMGIVGIALWVTVVALVSRNLRRSVRHLPHEGVAGRELAVLVCIVYAIWVVTGFTADLRFFEFMGMTVMLLVGIVVGAGERAWEERRSGLPAPVLDDEELIFGAPRARLAPA